MKEQSSQRKQNLSDSLLYAQFNRDVVEVGLGLADTLLLTFKWPDEFILSFTMHVYVLWPC